MKWILKISVLFTTVLLSGSLLAQGFEGTIKYSNEIKSKMENITSIQFTQMLGNTQDYFIKGNHYKSVSNGAVLQWQLYVPTENKLYSKTSNTDVLLWNDGAENKDSVLSARIVSNADTVLGFVCDKLILNCVGGLQEYEFNKTVAQVDASLFTKHKVGNWYDVVSRTGALPLKYKLDNPQFTLTSTAIAITPLQLDDAFFRLPALAITQKSTY